MIRPEVLKKDERLLWSPGSGVDVWEMFRACVAGDLPAVKRMVAKDPTLVRSQHAYRTPLYFGVRENRKDVVSFLLEEGALPFGLGRQPSRDLPRSGLRGDGGPPRREAARRHRRAAGARREHRCGAVRRSASDPAHERRLPLPRLARRSPGLAHDGGTGPRAPAGAGRFLRHLHGVPRRRPGAGAGAARRGPVAGQSRLGVRPDWLLVTPLHHFAKNGNVGGAVQFLDHGADLHARDEDICSTPLGWAAKHGQLQMVQLLLERGAKASRPDDPPWATPLAWAVRRGHTEVAELLARQTRR